MPPLVSVTNDGIYCEAGDFHIDPWQPVDRAIITHAHADHARPGSNRYLTSHAGAKVLRARIVDGIVDSLRYGEEVMHNGVSISLHPAGHILGSAQVRVEHRGEVWVVSGDYKVEEDATCAAFEPVRCHTFITECTFGLPIYRWPSRLALFPQIDDWWRRNCNEGRTSIVFAYALGKAQRLLAGVDRTIGSIYCHGAVERMNAVYRATGCELPPTTYTGRGDTTHDLRGALVVAPPSAMGSPWLRRFGDASTAFASGWMRIRGMRRRRSVDRGFVLSDHADWPGLISAVRATGAERVLVTHGRTGPMVRWLKEAGWDADALPTQYVGERDDAEIDDHDPEDGSAESGSTGSPRS